ncbi:helix-turn-helix transcriptional regulator [Halosimplex amylolyticum]|uniref:helix-turn-helix transcriptional regulator n=1 Tax=Halosimplex amylolyticum TaxID=3396616 RepID=UPI003F578EC8
MQGTTRRVAVSVAVALVCLSVVGPALGAAGQAHSGGQPSIDGGGAIANAQAPPGFQSAVDPDAVVLRAAVRDDGTAAWTVAFRVRLDDENATAAFESVQDDVEANETAFTEQFATGMKRTVASAEDRTGREMALENVTVTASKERLPQEYGVLTYRFTWTNFAAADGDRLRIGDSLSGFFLDSESSLVLAWPTGYERQSVTPDPDATGNGSVTWRGPAEFGPNEPRVVVAPGGGSGLPTTLLAGIAVLVVAVAGAGWLYRSRGGGTDAPGESGAATESAAEGAATRGAADDDATGPVDADGTGGAAQVDDGPPEELLSNEERVIRLLEDNGGRIKQQQIAGEFDWTDAKTSQVVGSLRDEDAVETFRIGRENVVALPEESDL